MAPAMKAVAKKATKKVVAKKVVAKKEAPKKEVKKVVAKKEEVKPKVATVPVEGKPLAQGLLVKMLCEKNELKPKQVRTIFSQIAEIATKEVKRVSKFTIPHVCTVKSRVKPATVAGKRMMFGKEVLVKAQPAKTVVKSYPAHSLKKQF